MADDTDRSRWHRIGRSQRALEGALRQPPAGTRAGARVSVLPVLVEELVALPPEAHEAVVAHAVEGYLEEHRAQGGEVAEE